jgi:probable HAF family extracellular repeat protein
MNGVNARFLIAAVLLAGFFSGGPTLASDDEDRTEYVVANLPSLGGTVSSGNSLNDLGWASGTSNLPGDVKQHAILWLHGVGIDLGTLGGPNSGVIWPVKNVRGVISGIAETDAADPLGERWSCSAFFPTRTGKTCRGVVWERGTIRALPTLGGNNGFATGSNNRRQVVGWTETAVHDPTCVPPQVLQFRAVVWGPGKDQIEALPSLPGDSAGAATAINDRGQVVGISGICDRAVGRFSAAHAVLWENGAVADIGNLGGVAWNTPMAMNEWGDVVGFSNVSPSDGGAFNAHAFLWNKRDGIRDLGTLPGDAISQALGINNWRQVVGISCTAGFVTCRGFLWQDGVMTDLNSLVAPGYADQIFAAGDINDLGQITGQAFNPTTNEFSAFLAVPEQGDRDDRGPGSPRARATGQRGAPVALPGHVRQMLLRQLGLAEDDR